MVSVNIEIGDISYKIVRLEIEAKNLQKTIEKKKKNKFLDEGEEYALRKEIDEKQDAIKRLEAEIRKIEVREIRAKNFAGSGQEIGKYFQSKEKKAHSLPQKKGLKGHTALVGDGVWGNGLLGTLKTPYNNDLAKPRLLKLMAIS